MVKRIRVYWHTTEVTHYEAEFELPDDADLNELPAEVNVYNGNCPLLVDLEDRESDEIGYRFDEFTRETDTVERLTDPPTGGTP